MKASFFLDKPVPYIAQMEAVECGAASLAMVLAYWGHHAPLAELRQACGVSRDGSNAKNILAGARTYGLVARARRCEPEDLAACKGPAILHWRFEHFVVLEKWTKESTRLCDPGAGRRVVSAEELDKSFTGVCLEFEPGPDFVKRPAQRKTLARYAELLRGSGTALGMVVVAALILNVFALVLPLSTQLVVDHVVGEGHPSWLLVVAGGALGIVLLSAFYASVRDVVLRRLRRGLDVGIGSRFVRHLLGLPVVFFHQRGAGDLLSRVDGNQQIRELLTGSTVGLLVDGVMLTAYLGLMLAIDPVLGAIVAVGGALHVTTYLISRRFLAVAVEELQRKDVVASSALLGTLSGIATVKAAGIEDKSRSRWLDATVHAVNARSKFSRLQLGVTTALGAIRLAVPVVILAVGGARALSGDLSAGTIVAFQMFQAGFLGPLESVLHTLLTLEIVPVLLARMDDVLDTKAEPNGGEQSPRLEGEIQLDGVSFSYGPRSPLVLDDVSLHVPKGTKVALVGGSGCGKSTLARLILGLYEPTKGQVRLDGRDLSELDRASVRRQYGVVLQEAALVDGSIADNVRLYHPTLSTDEIVVATRVAQIHDDITSLPDGYETRISAHGGPLSGGQRQRLALARAIAHRPPIMILDEATSALDAPTEAAIERYLSTRTCTRIVIAHRLNTVRNADVICFLEKGKIVEQGTHDELVALGGRYAALVASENATKEARGSTPPPAEAPATAEAISKIPAFAALDEVDRTRLAGLLDVGEHQPGDVLVRQDEVAAGLHILIEGTVEVRLSEPGLETWTVAELGAEEVVGELSLLDASPSSATVVAKTAVRAFFVPRSRFWQLLESGDALGARAHSLLTSLVARRASDALEREAKLASGRTSRLMEENAREERTQALTAARVLDDTLVGAALTRGELATFASWGSERSFAHGERVVAAGARPRALAVVLSGRLALSTADGTKLGQSIGAGEDLAPWSVFEVDAHPVSAVAETDGRLFTIARETLLEHAAHGHPVARKAISHLSRQVVHVLRMVNFRLRERVALEAGELDRAHAAREAARVAARAERDALVKRDADHAPMVSAPDPMKTHAACLSAILRRAGRPAPVSAVVEAMASARRGKDAVVHAAKLFGWDARRLELLPGELEKTQKPLVLESPEYDAFVVEPMRRGRMRVMNPLKGVSFMTPDELRPMCAGSAYELEPRPSHFAASLWQRIASYARSEKRLLAQLVVLTIALELATIGSAMTVALVVGAVLPAGDRDLLAVVVFAASALAVGMGVFGALQGRATEYLRVHFDRDMTNQLMAHVLHLPIGFFESRESGDVIRRFRAFDDVRRLVLTQGVAAVLSLVSFVVAATLLTALQASFALVVVAEVALYAIVIRLVFPRVRDAARAEREARSTEQSRLLELVSGVATFRMAGDPTATIERWQPSFLDAVTHGNTQDRLRTTSLVLLDTMRNIGFLVALVVGADAVVKGESSLTSLVAGLGILGSFLQSLHVLAAQILTAAPIAVDIGTVKDTFSEAVEQYDPNPLSPGELRGRIALDRVSFRYGDDGPLTLEDVSLVVEPGTKVALVGRSGSGKSTLGKLLLGMYLPTSGRVLFDEKDLGGLDLQAVRSQIGAVLQQPHLVSGTLRDNIALAADGASYEEVAEAARKAAIHDDIAALPMGYQTLVTEGGATFSGGQRQRCVIARALLSSPPILLLDEATSALDNESQRLIESHLARSTSTRIVIAHRLSTVRDADQIVVVDRGRIVEVGQHDDLLAKRGAYFDLVRAQIGAA